MCSDEERCPPHEDEHKKYGGHGHWGRFIEPRLLLLLREKPSHGYELIERVDEFPLSPGSCCCDDPGAIYRVLRSMEEDGLVTSKWKTEESGPAKKIYKITKEGEERLFTWALHLEKRKKAIEKFLETYKRYERR